MAKGVSYCKKLASTTYENCSEKEIIQLFL